MNKQVMKDFDTSRIPIERLMALLQTFTLKHSARQLADILERAENNQSSYREFLLDLLETDAKGRNERRRKRNYSAAHFPPNPKPIELFDPAELESGITAGQIRQLKELNWIDTNANIVFAGLRVLAIQCLRPGSGLKPLIRDKGFICMYGIIPY